MKSKLKLSKTHKILAGVCGGLADYFNVDPTLVRIIWCVITIVLNHFFLTSLFLYVICWAVIPNCD
ncbi:MAG: PspC domain-containing protein [Clostridiales bacterium]|jgi:phage shock protein C|nr:PspC domain-containing protein [Clostridiales bacterium]